MRKAMSFLKNSKLLKILFTIISVLGFVSGLFLIAFGVNLNDNSNNIFADNDYAVLDNRWHDSFGWGETISSIEDVEKITRIEIRTNTYSNDILNSIRDTEIISGGSNMRMAITMNTDKPYKYDSDNNYIILSSERYNYGYTVIFYTSCSKIYFGYNTWVETTYNSETGAISGIPLTANMFTFDYNGYAVGFKNLKSISGLSNLDTSKISLNGQVANYDYRFMFEGAESLENIDLTGFNLNEGKFFDGFFHGCYSLKTINFGSNTFQNAVFTRSMFRNCSSLTKLDLSGLSLSVVDYGENMFTGCDNLVEIVMPQDLPISVRSNLTLPYPFIGGNNGQAYSYLNAETFRNSYLSTSSQKISIYKAITVSYYYYNISGEIQSINDYIGANSSYQLRKVLSQSLGAPITVYVWDTSENGIGEEYIAGNSYLFTSSISLYQRYQVTIVKQTYLSDNSEVINAGTETIYVGRKTPSCNSNTITIGNISKTITVETTLGYITSFDKWDNATSCITTNCTIYANFIRTPIEYNIKYINQDGSLISFSPTKGTYNNYIEIGVPVKTGYTFVGWSSNTVDSTAINGSDINELDSWNGSLTIDKYFKNLKTQQSSTVTLIANWEANQINFDGGSKIVIYDDENPTEVNYGDVFSDNLITTNGTGSYSYSLVSGSLPDGLTLSDNGIVSGTIIANVGLYEFSVNVLDVKSNSTATGNFAIYVNPRVVEIDWKTANIANAKSYVNAFVYNGEEQGVYPFITNLVVINGISDVVNIVSSNNTATNAGVYKASVLSIDNTNYTITSAENLEFEWEITPAVLSDIATFVGDCIYGETISVEILNPTTKASVNYEWYYDNNSDMLTKTLISNVSNQLTLDTIYVEKYIETIVTISLQNYFDAVFTNVIKIEKRQLQILSASAEKVYDKTPLSNDLYSINLGSLANFNDAQDVLSITFDSTSTITNVGSVDNTFTYSIIRDGINVTSCYDTSAVFGTLTITKATMTVQITNYEDVYDQLAHTISITVTILDDYLISYSDTASDEYSLTNIPTRTNVGTSTVYVKVSSPNYFDYKSSGTIKITQADLSTIILAVYEYDYDTTTHDAPSSFVYSQILGENVLLTKDIDYTLSGNTTTQTNAGSYTIYATGKGNFKGYVSVVWTINKAVLSSITISEVDYMYNTLSHDAPSVLSVRAKTAGDEDLDFDLTYFSMYTLNEGYADSQIDADEYTITATGTGNYEGEVSATWQIKKYNGEITILLSETLYTYNGDEQGAPTATVKLGTYVLNAENYVLTGTGLNSQLNAGTYTITATGTKNIENTVSASAIWVIKTIKLDVAENLEWLNFGIASWSKIESIAKTTISYKLNLLKYDSAIGDDILIKSWTLSSTSSDISSEIRENLTGKYKFTVQTQSNSPINVLAGDVAVSEYLSASLVQIQSSAGLLNASINEQTQHVLIKGETVNITASVKAGYEFERWQTLSALITIMMPTNISTSITYSSDDAEDILLTLNIPANTYYVAFDKNQPALASHEILGTMSNQTLTFDAETTINKNLFSLVGWTFLGWADENDNLVDWADEDNILNLTTEKLVTITIYAVWRQNTYSVHYHTWLPNAEKTESVIERDTSIMPEIWSQAEVVQDFVYDNPSEVRLYENPFELFGYTYTGWSKVEGASAYYLDNQVALNLTDEDDKAIDIWTAWRANIYYINFDKNYSNATGIMSTMTCAYDESYELISNQFLLEGCEFYGWATSSIGLKTFNNNQTVKNLEYEDGEEMTLYAIYRKVVVFESTIGGSISKEIDTVEYMVLSGQSTYLCKYESADYTSPSLFITFTYISDESSNINTYTRYISCTATEESPYKFLYWSFDKISYNGITNVSRYTANFGRYFKITYTSGTQPISGDEVDGDDIEFEILEGTTSQTIQNSYVLTGYHFAGWLCDIDDKKYVENENYVVLQDMVFSATWDANFYYIHFETNKPNLATNLISGQMENQKVYFDQSVNLIPNEYSLEGWTFLNWNTNFYGSGIDYEDEEEILNLLSNEGEVLNLYAIWQENIYSINYLSNKPANASTEILGTMSIQNFSYEEEKSLSINKFTLEGYTFLGWSTESTSQSAEFNDEETVKKLTNQNENNISLYAVWSVNGYSILFNANKPQKASNNVFETMSVQNLLFDGDSVALTKNIYSLKGWTFLNWNTMSDGTGIDYADEQLVNNLSSVEGEVINLYAIWSENSYSINFYGTEPQNASTQTTGSMNVQTFTFEEEKSLLQNKFKLTGYAFVGWATTENSNNVDYLDEAVIKNLIQFDGGFTNFYAVWTPITYKVIFNSTLENSGEMLSQTLTFDVSQTLNSNQFEKSTYVFFGWSTSKFGAVVYSNNQSVLNLSSIQNEEINLWTVFKKVIKFENSTGGIVNNTSIQYLEQAITNNGETYVLNSIIDDINEEQPINIVNVIATYSIGEKFLTITKTATATPTGEYEFMYWTKSVKSIALINSNADVWTPTFGIFRNINYIANGGVGSYDEFRVLDGTIITLIDNPFTRFEHQFVGWNSNVNNQTYQVGNKVKITQNTTFSAQWLINSYTIKWLNYDETELDSEIYNYGETPTYSGATPTREKTAQYTFTFAGWSPEISAVSGDAYYVAQYSNTLRKYTVVWRNSDENTTLLEVDYNVNYGSMPIYNGRTPTKAETDEYKFEFNGWTPAISSVSQDITYFASYNNIQKLFVITWKNDDGTVLKIDTRMTFGSLPKYEGEIPTKDSNAEWTYTFDGWTPEIETVSQDATYVATYAQQKNVYTIIWQNYDGTELDRQILEYGRYPSYSGEAPTKPNTEEWIYEFNNRWSPSISSVTKNQVYVAEFSQQKVKYTIIWNNYDNSELYSAEFEYGSFPLYGGETPTKPATTTISYTFSGWSPNLKMVTKNASYKAQFSQSTRKYTIQWLNYDETLLSTSEFEYGVIPQYDGVIPTKENTDKYTFTFKGWSPTIVAVYRDTSYIARFDEQINKYTVIFKDYDGTQLQKSTLNYGEMPNYTRRTPVRNSDAEWTYTFEGWSPEIEEVFADAEYVATYSTVKNKYSVIWQNYDGTILQFDDEIEYGQIPEYNGEEPYKDADAQYTYTFSGWTPAVKSVAGNTIYTAKFLSTINTYQITWKNYDGTDLQIDDVEYGKAPSYMGEVPSKPSDVDKTWTFSGWDKEIVLVTQDEIYTALFESNAILFDVVWQNYDGTVLLKNLDIPYGTIPEYTAENPTRLGNSRVSYKFNGWDKQIVAVTENTVYTAVFEESTNKYTWTAIIEKNLVNNVDILLEVNGEAQSFVGNSLQLEFYYGTNISATATLTENGHSYNLIWNADPILIERETAVMDEITLYSHITSTLYITEIFNLTANVSSDVYGSISGISAQKVLYGSQSLISFEVDENSGYSFTEWTTEDAYLQIETTPQGYEAISNITKDTSITANFETIDYTITISINGIRSTLTYNIETPTFTIDNPTRENYEFVGWTGSNGSTPLETITIEQGTTGNKTYVANWKLISKEIVENRFSPILLIAIISGSILFIIIILFIILIIGKKRREKQNKKSIFIKSSPK